MCLVSWNCRGLGNPLKDEAVKNLLKTESPEILMLQETKIEGDSLLDLTKVKWKTKSGKAVSARGTCGGLATLWEEDKFHLENSFETQHWIYTELRYLTSKITTTLFNLYVPVLYIEKKYCWQTLSDFLDAHSPKNIILAGDFNLVFEIKGKKRREQ
jgi:exonuclease III